MTNLNLPSVYNLIELDLVKSTNLTAKEFASKGEESIPDGTIIWAREQSDGRGRRGKYWSSPKGNLYTSLILRPEIILSESAQLSFVAALSIYDALGNLGPPGHQVHCKWPNDILLNEKKVSGILLESEGALANKPADWIILGIGLNIESYPQDTSFPSTSLHSEGWNTSVEEVLMAFSRSFLSWSNTWLESGFSSIRQNWLWRSIGIGTMIKVELDNKILEGVFEDIADDGALILNQNGKTRRVTAGDLFFSNVK